jgi:hypothetical protein
MVSLAPDLLSHCQTQHRIFFWQNIKEERSSVGFRGGGGSRHLTDPTQSNRNTTDYDMIRFSRLKIHSVLKEHNKTHQLSPFRFSLPQ